MGLNDLTRRYTVRDWLLGLTAMALVGAVMIPSFVWLRSWMTPDVRVAAILVGVVGIILHRRRSQA